VQDLHKKKPSRRPEERPQGGGVFLTRSAAIKEERFHKKKENSGGPLNVFRLNAELREAAARRNLFYSREEEFLGGLIGV